MIDNSEGGKEKSRRGRRLRKRSMNFLSEERFHELWPVSLRKVV
jgi:hypothetical protein